MTGNFVFFEVMTESFRTISAPASASFRELGSRFLSFAFPVRDEHEIAQALSDLSRRFPDATHHCFAWSLGAAGERWRAWDDGEPAHSAGDPILGQIRSAGLTQVLVVVVRYFGGTKLGVSGLVQAYRSAARQALESATVIETDVTERWIITYPWKEMQRVMSYVKSVEAAVEEMTTGESCRLIISVGVRHRFDQHLHAWAERGIPVAAARSDEHRDSI